MENAELLAHERSTVRRKIEFKGEPELLALERSTVEENVEEEEDAERLLLTDYGRMRSRRKRS